MSKFAKFMKGNKKAAENVFHAVTASLCDADGSPLKWEFRHITSKENERIQNDCMLEVPVKGKPGAYRQKMDTTKYSRALLVASVVTPDLYDAELQDSYGVKTPDALLMEMVDNPGEYTDLLAFVQELQGFNTTFDDKVEEAKN